MFTATFYSFKGGVGRTLSLMNTAFRLSRQGKSVFILDFDLEAPGIDVFSSSERHGIGLLEYINHYSSSGTPPSLEPYVSRMPWDNAAPVFFMSAGRRDRDYQTLLARLSWKDFYARQHGFYFVENLKAAIQAVFRPDYVLVDSRTGLTDISGICTLQLPDLVVLLFGLNDQNLIGTAQIYKSITHNTLNRPIETLLVASPVPDVPEYLGVKKQRLERAKELLGSEPDVVLPFNAFVAFKETIVPAEMGEFLNLAYDTLCAKIISYNKADISTLLRDARAKYQAGDLEQAQAIFGQITKANPKSAIAWTEYGSFLRSQNRALDALLAYYSAEQAGAGPSIYGEIAVTLLHVKDFEKATQYLHRYLATEVEPSAAYQIGRAFAYRDQAEPAILAFEKVVASPSAHPDFVNNVLLEIANLYMSLGMPDRALSYYQRIVEKSPMMLAGVFNLAVALFRSGRVPEAVPYFVKATALFEQTPLMHVLPVSHANMLQAMSQAYAETGAISRAIELLNEAMAAVQNVSTPVFSSVQYRYVSSSEFVQESHVLLEKLITRYQPAQTYNA